MKKFSKKRLLGYLNWKIYQQMQALKDPDKIDRHSSIMWDYIQTQILINDIETWEITELNYGDQIDKFIID